MTNTGSIWLTGAEGMLGRDISYLLSLKGYKIYESDMEVDITDIESLKKYISQKNISWIINAAAYTDVDGAESDKKLAMDVNGRAVGNIAKVAKDNNAKLIHISTDYVFNGEGKNPYREDDAPNPVNIYGKSKLEGEILLKENTDQYYIIRTSWLYGNNGRNFVKAILDKLKNNSTVEVVSDQFGSPTYTLDLAEFIEEVIVSDNDLYGTYHFTNSGVTNWFGFAEKIYEYSEIRNNGKEIKIVPISSSVYKAPANRPAYSVLFTEKTQKTFDIKIRKWESALIDYLEREII